MVNWPLKRSRHRENSSAKSRCTCEIRRSSRCLLQACGTGGLSALRSAQLRCLMCVQRKRFGSVCYTADEMNNADSWWRALQKRLFYGPARVRAFTRAWTTERWVTGIAAWFPPRLYTNCNQDDRRCGASTGVWMTGQMLIVKHAGGHERWGRLQQTQLLRLKFF